MRDHAAQPGCRVWTSCPACGINDPHGAYMIGYDIGNVFAQCTVCSHRFWRATGFGVGGAPEVELWWPAA